jgi:hypothetical protein
VSAVRTTQVLGSETVRTTTGLRVRHVDDVSRHQVFDRTQTAMKKHAIADGVAAGRALGLGKRSRARAALYGLVMLAKGREPYSASKCSTISFSKSRGGLSLGAQLPGKK